MSDIHFEGRETNNHITTYRHRNVYDIQPVQFHFVRGPAEETTVPNIT